jgi:hypothetical protein
VRPSKKRNDSGDHAHEARDEDEIRKELRSVSYGDGRFYLETYGDRIGRIVFETDDAYYVDGYALEYNEKGAK